MTEISGTKEEMHRHFAVSLFNLTWELLDTQNRTPEQDQRMLHSAHASRFHWGEIGTPLELLRGEWQVSRVCSVLGLYQSAVYHGRLCLELCEANDIVDFDLAFACEALARGYAAQGAVEKSQEYMEKARLACENIEDQENREYFLSELATVSGIRPASGS
jgi:hypothetical protein